MDSVYLKNNILTEEIDELLGKTLNSEQKWPSLLQDINHVCERKELAQSLSELSTKYCGVLKRVQPQYDINDISENQKLYLYKYLAKVEAKSIQELGQQSETCELCNFPLIWKILQETLTNVELLQILKNHIFKVSSSVIFNNETLQDELVNIFEVLNGDCRLANLIVLFIIYICIYGKYSCDTLMFPLNKLLFLSKVLLPSRNDILSLIELEKDQERASSFEAQYALKIVKGSLDKCKALEVKGPNIGFIVGKFAEPVTGLHYFESIVKGTGKNLKVGWARVKTQPTPDDYFDHLWLFDGTSRKIVEYANIDELTAAEDKLRAVTSSAKKEVTGVFKSVIKSLTTLEISSRSDLAQYVKMKRIRVPDVAIRSQMLANNVAASDIELVLSTSETNESKDSGDTEFLDLSGLFYDEEDAEAADAHDKDAKDSLSLDKGEINILSSQGSYVWKEDSVVGCLLNTNDNTIRVFVNGIEQTLSNGPAVVAIDFQNTFLLPFFCSAPSAGFEFKLYKKEDIPHFALTGEETARLDLTSNRKLSNFLRFNSDQQTSKSHVILNGESLSRMLTGSFSLDISFSIRCFDIDNSLIAAIVNGKKLDVIISAKAEIIVRLKGKCCVTTPTIALCQFYHLTVSCLEDDNIVIFLNGQIVEYTPTSEELVTYDESLISVAIGASLLDSGAVSEASQLVGDLFEIRYWLNVRSPKDCIENTHRGKYFGNDRNVLFDYKFIEGVGEILFDLCNNTTARLIGSNCNWCHEIPVDHKSIEDEVRNSIQNYVNSANHKSVYQIQCDFAQISELSLVQILRFVQGMICHSVDSLKKLHYERKLLSKYSNFHSAIQKFPAYKIFCDVDVAMIQSFNLVAVLQYLSFLPPETIIKSSSSEIFFGVHTFLSLLDINSIFTSRESKTIAVVSDRSSELNVLLFTLRKISSFDDSQFRQTVISKTIDALATSFDAFFSDVTDQIQFIEFLVVLKQESYIQSSKAEYYSDLLDVVLDYRNYQLHPSEAAYDSLISLFNLSPDISRQLFNTILVRIYHSFDLSLSSSPSLIALLTADNLIRLTKLDAESVESSNEYKELKVGDVVCRGKDWKYGNQDGGQNSRGIVCKVFSWLGQEGCGVTVEWANGSRNSYCSGAKVGTQIILEVKRLGFNDLSYNCSSSESTQSSTSTKKLILQYSPDEVFASLNVENGPLSKRTILQYIKSNAPFQWLQSNSLLLSDSALLRRLTGPDIASLYVRFYHHFSSSTQLSENALSQMLNSPKDKSRTNLLTHFVNILLLDIRGSLIQGDDLSSLSSYQALNCMQAQLLQLEKSEKVKIDNASQPWKPVQVGLPEPSLLSNWNFETNTLHFQAEAAKTEEKRDPKSKFLEKLTFDSSKLVKTLSISQDGRLLSQKSSRKWSTCLGSVAIQPSSGVYQWIVRFECSGRKGHCIFGIAFEDVSFTSYLGQDNKGWGLTLNNEIYHNSIRLQTEISLKLGVGSVILVTFDSDNLTLRFEDLLNAGHEAQVTVEQASGKIIYPAFTLFSPGDAISLVQFREVDKAPTADTDVKYPLFTPSDILMDYLELLLKSSHSILTNIYQNNKFHAIVSETLNCQLLQLLSYLLKWEKVSLYKFDSICTLLSSIIDICSKTYDVVIESGNKDYLRIVNCVSYFVSAYAGRLISAALIVTDQIDNYCILLESNKERSSQAALDNDQLFDFSHWNACPLFSKGLLLNASDIFEKMSFCIEEMDCLINWTMKLDPSPLSMKRLGGPTLANALKYTFLCVLYHSGFLNVIYSLLQLQHTDRKVFDRFLHREPPAFLQACWNSVHNIRVWALQTHQTLNVSYELLSSKIISKCKFLLELGNLKKNVDYDFMMKEFLEEESSGTPFASNLTSYQPDGVSEISQQLLNFIKLNTSLAVHRAGLTGIIETCHMRKQAILFGKSCLSNFEKISGWILKCALLIHLPGALKGQSCNYHRNKYLVLPQSNVVHFMEGLKCVPENILLTVRGLYYSLFESLSEELTNSNCQGEYFNLLIVLNCWGVVVQDIDHDMLARVKIFYAIEELLNNNDLEAVVEKEHSTPFTSVVTNAAMKVFYLLALQVASSQEPERIPSTISYSALSMPALSRSQSGPSTLSDVVFNILYKQILASLGTEEKQSSGLSTEAQIILSESTLLLSRVSKNSNCQTILTKPRWLTIFLDLCFSSPKICQLRVLRTLCDLLPTVYPNKIVVGSSFRVKYSETDELNAIIYIRELMEYCGNGFLSTVDLSNEINHTQSQKLAFDVTSEIITLFRTLLNSSSWGSLVESEILRCLKSVPQLLMTGENIPIDLFKSYVACLCILGSNIEIFYSGGLVRIIDYADNTSQFGVIKGDPFACTEVEVLTLNESREVKSRQVSHDVLLGFNKFPAEKLILSRELVDAVMSSLPALILHSKASASPTLVVDEANVEKQANNSFNYPELLFSQELCSKLCLMMCLKCISLHLLSWHNVQAIVESLLLCTVNNCPIIQYLIEFGCQLEAISGFQDVEVFENYVGVLHVSLASTVKKIEIDVTDAKIPTNNSPDEQKPAESIESTKDSNALSHDQDPDAYLTYEDQIREWNLDTDGMEHDDMPGMSEEINELNVIMVEQLEQMGFPRNWCEVAISICNYDVNEALNYILANGDDMERMASEYEAKQATKNQKPPKQTALLAEIESSQQCQTKSDIESKEYHYLLSARKLYPLYAGPSETSEKIGVLFPGDDVVALEEIFSKENSTTPQWLKGYYSDYQVEDDDEYDDIEEHPGEDSEVDKSQFCWVPVFDSGVQCLFKGHADHSIPGGDLDDPPAKVYPINGLFRPKGNRSVIISQNINAQSDAVGFIESGSVAHVFEETFDSDGVHRLHINDPFHGWVCKRAGDLEILPIQHNDTVIINANETSSSQETKKVNLKSEWQIFHDISDNLEMWGGADMFRKEDRFFNTLQGQHFKVFADRFNEMDIAMHNTRCRVYGHPGYFNTLTESKILSKKGLEKKLENVYSLLKILYCRKIFAALLSYSKSESNDHLLVKTLDQLIEIDSVGTNVEGSMWRSILRDNEVSPFTSTTGVTLSTFSKTLLSFLSSSTVSKFANLLLAVRLLLFRGEPFSLTNDVELLAFDRVSSWSNSNAITLEEVVASSIRSYIQQTTNSSIRLTFISSLFSIFQKQISWALQPSCTENSWSDCIYIDDLDSETVQCCNIDYAKLISNLLLSLKDSELTLALFETWSACLRSSNMSLKQIAFRMLSGILQFIIENLTETDSNLLNLCLQVIPLERLKLLATRRLWYENEDHPLYSRFLDSLTEYLSLHRFASDTILNTGPTICPQPNNGDQFSGSTLRNVISFSSDKSSHLQYQNTKDIKGPWTLEVWVFINEPFNSIKTTRKSYLQRFEKGNKSDNGKVKRPFKAFEETIRSPFGEDSFTLLPPPAGLGGFLAFATISRQDEPSLADLPGIDDRPRLRASRQPPVPRLGISQQENKSMNDNDIFSGFEHDRNSNIHSEESEESLSSMLRHLARQTREMANLQSEESKPLNLDWSAPFTGFLPPVTPPPFAGTKEEEASFADYKLLGSENSNSKNQSEPPSAPKLDKKSSRTLPLPRKAPKLSHKDASNNSSSKKIESPTPSNETPAVTAAEDPDTPIEYVNPSFLITSSNLYIKLCSGGTVSEIEDNLQETDPVIDQCYCVSIGNADGEKQFDYSIPVQQWVHLAFACDKASQNVFLYANGQYKGEVQGRYSLPLHTIGSAAANSSFSGNIAELRVWSYERSPEELQRDMFTNISECRGLISLLRCNELAGDFVLDSSALTSCRAKNCEWKQTEAPALCKSLCPTYMLKESESVEGIFGEPIGDSSGLYEFVGIVKVDPHLSRCCNKEFQSVAVCFKQITGIEIEGFLEWYELDVRTLIRGAYDDDSKAITFSTQNVETKQTSVILGPPENIDWLINLQFTGSIEKGQLQGEMTVTSRVKMLPPLKPGELRLEQLLSSDVSIIRQSSNQKLNVINGLSCVVSAVEVNPILATKKRLKIQYEPNCDYYSVYKSQKLKGSSIITERQVVSANTFGFCSVHETASVEWTVSSGDSTKMIFGVCTKEALLHLQDLVVGNGFDNILVEAGKRTDFWGYLGGGIVIHDGASVIVDPVKSNDNICIRFVCGRKRLQFLKNNVVLTEYNHIDEVFSFVLNDDGHNDEASLGLVPVIVLSTAGDAVTLTTPTVSCKDTYTKTTLKYTENDSLGRKEFYGMSTNGAIDGKGILSFENSNGFWCGHWLDDSQEGIQIWVELVIDESAENSVKVSAHYFENDSKVSTLSEIESKHILDEFKAVMTLSEFVGSSVKSLIDYIQPNYLKESNPTETEGIPDLTSNGSHPLYVMRIIYENGATVRDGIDIDNSAQIRIATFGEVVEVFEESETKGNIPRYRIQDGWISGRLRGGSEEPIVEILEHHPQTPLTYQVVLDGGAKIRKEAELDSAEVSICPNGCLIKVSERKLVTSNNTRTMRLRIISPAEYVGWASEKVHIVKKIIPEEQQQKSTTAKISDALAYRNTVRARRKRDIGTRKWSSSTAEGVQTKVVALKGNISANDSTFFLLNSNQCNSGIKLSSDLLTATCEGKVSGRPMVLGTRGFSKGLHYWEVQVDSTQWGSVFIGVAPMDASNWNGYGFINYRATQASGAETLYGSYFGAGDTIGVLLDMDHGTISFIKDGENFNLGKMQVINMGVAYHSLRRNYRGSYPIFYPCFGMKSSGDQLSLRRCKWVSEYGIDAKSKQRQIVDSQIFLRYWKNAYSNSELLLSINKFFQNKLYSAYTAWRHHDRELFRSRAGIDVAINTKPNCLKEVLPEIYDLFPTFSVGSRLKTSYGNCQFIGVLPNQLWYTMEGTDSDIAAWYWTAEQFVDYVNGGLITPVSEEAQKTALEKHENTPILSQEEFFDAIKSTWTIKEDELLVQLVNTLVDKEAADPLRISAEALENARLVAGILTHKTKNEVQARYALICVLNKACELALPLIDHGRMHGALVTTQFDVGGNSAISKFLNHSSLNSEVYNEIKKVIFMRTKSNLWKLAIRETTVFTLPPPDEYERPEEIPEIIVNRMEAHAAVTAKTLLSFKERFSKSIFGQLSRSIGEWDIHALRKSFIHMQDAGQPRAFYVKFTGEGVDDHGGPYRAVFQSSLAEEAEALLDVLVPTSNSRNSVGDSRDQTIFNQKYYHDNQTRPLFEQFGKLLGIASRHNILISLSLPQLIWRPLTGSSLSVMDLTHTDKHLVSTLTSLSKGEFSKYEMLDMLAHLLSLSGLPQGLITVIFENLSTELTQSEQPTECALLRKVINLILQTSLLSQKTALKLVLKGLSVVIPTELFSIFTSDELETLLCGQRDLDVELLKKVTEYEGVSPSDRHVEQFWEALTLMNSTERAKFVNFCSGRARLPTSMGDFSMTFKITAPPPRSVDHPDDYLPIAQTCFFSLSIPRYSSTAKCLEKLRYAINNADLMDADFVMRNAAGWENIH